MNDTNLNLAQRGIAYMRKELAAEYPYLCPAIYALTLIEDEKEPSLSTDGRYLFYQPEYILRCYGDNKKYQGLKYQYLHILLHCLLGHVYKKNEDNSSFYDVCADFMADAALERLTGKGRKLPAGIRYSEEYVKLKRQAGNCSLEGLRNYCRKETEQGQYLQRIEKRLQSDRHTYWTQKHPPLPGMGGSRSGEMSGIEEQWQNLMLQTMQMARMLSHGRKGKGAAGDFAGSLEQETRASEDNVSSYKELLQRMCSLRENIQTDDATFDYIWYETGMELYGNIPLIEPAECVEEPAADDIVIAIDTSGSCSGKIASRFLRETCNLLRDMNIRGNNYQIRILECDTKIQKEIVIHSKEDIPDFEEQILCGYGGTDFCPVFEHIEKLREQGEIQKVAGLIYLTDAEGFFPEEGPDYETVFIVVDAYGSGEWIADIPEWITTIRLTEDDIEELA